MYLSHQWRHSTRHWEILDEEGTLLKSVRQKVTFHQSWLYHSRSRFLKKLMVNIRVSWNRKTDVFFIDPQKTKVDQNCYIDLLKTSLLPEFHQLYQGNQWLWIPARQCSVTPLKSDATVSTTERSILHSCWWFGIIFCRSYSFRLLHLGYSVGFGVRRPTTSNLQIYRISKRHSKTSGWRSPLRQFENPLHNGKKWLNAVRKQNEDAIQHIFC